MSFWRDVPSSAFTAGHGWRQDAELDQPLHRYIYWPLKRPVEMTLSLNTALTDNTFVSTALPKSRCLSSYSD